MDCISVINVFCVPAIALFIIYGKKKEELRLSVKMVLSYMVVCVMNLVVTRALVVFQGLAFKMDTTIGEVTYTATAIVAALVLGAIIRIFQAYFSVELEVKKNEENDN